MAEKLCELKKKGSSKKSASKINAVVSITTTSTGDTSAAVNVNESFEINTESFSKNATILFTAARNTRKLIGVLNYGSSGWTYTLLFDAIRNNVAYPAGHVFTWNYKTSVNYSFSALIEVESEE